MFTFTLARKITVLTVGLVAIAAATSGIGIYGIDTITDHARRVDASGGEALSAARINQNIVALSRAEYRVAANPSPEIISEAEAVIAEEREDFRRRYDRVLKTANATQKVQLADIRSQYDQYLAALQNTIRVADAVSANVAIEAAQKRLVDAARSSREIADRVEAEVREYAVFADQRAAALAAEADAVGTRLSTLMIVIAAIGLLVGIVGGIAIGRYGIARPIRASVTSLRALADGRTDDEIVGTERTDEIGEIARAMVVFRDGLIERARLQTEAAEAEHRAEERRKADMNALAEQIESRVGRITHEVGKAVTELHAASTQMSAAVEETSSQSTAVAVASEQASANVQTVATASEELSAAISDVSVQVSDTSRRVNTVAGNAGQARSEIEGLTKAVNTVNAVIDDIRGVAEQTNLLALNATIEAARAGEAGRGFAVVAAEVKTLAQQTQTLTDSVTGRIETVSRSADHVVEVLKRLIDEVAEIDEAASSIAAAVEQQSAATQEISRNAAEAATGTTEVSSNITGVQSAATQTSQATVIVGSAADGLQANMRTLENAVDDVVGELRAA